MPLTFVCKINESEFLLLLQAITSYYLHYWQFLPGLGCILNNTLCI